MEPGHRIEHYVIIEKIGQGGQAAVWSAYDERLKRTVAIKTINLSQFMPPADGISSTGASGASGTTAGTSGSGTLPANPSSLTNPDRFREEAQIIAALEHPNILPVYAFGQEGDSLYIVMRYMAAGSLKDLLKKEPLSPPRVAELMDPLSGALDLAHQNQIIHRDIKSANILLDAQLHPYLADFGLSMTKGDMRGEAGVGTLAYMSPEQMMGDPIDHRSDLYAFGILMYELLAAQLPSLDGQPWNLHQTMRAAPLPIPEGMSERVADVLRRATAMSPDDRYQTAKENVDALKAAVAEGMPVSVMPPAVPEVTDPAMLALIEAQDLFFKAQERWADGAGRFRFEAGDYKYVDTYFSDPEPWGLEISDVVQRLMLRAALEHGHQLNYWWDYLKDMDDRRAVTMQTLTSDLAPARLRAMERLTTMQDSAPPAIPIRVANLIQAEPDASVRLAGVSLLEKRAPSGKGWQRTVYNEYIDAVLADLAAHDLDRRVAEAAARACARIRSFSALEQLGQQAAAGDRGAFNALTYARDELPALPSTIPNNVRWNVFCVLSRRQLFADVLQLIFRFISAALGAGVAIGAYAYWQFNDQNGLLASQRFGNALAVGALYGVLIGLGVFAATEISARLRAWSRPGRILLAWAIGSLLTFAAWQIYDRFFNFSPPTYPLYLLGACIVFVAGFAIASGLTRRASLRSLAGAIGVMLAVYFSWYIGQEPLLYLGDDPRDPAALWFALIAGVIIGVLTFLPEWIRALRRLNQQPQEKNKPSDSLMPPVEQVEAPRPSIAL